MVYGYHTNMGYHDNEGNGFIIRHDAYIREGGTINVNVIEH